MTDKSESYFECCLYFTANSLARIVNKMADEEFKKLGLCTSHAFLLMMVMEKPGIKQKDLSQALHLNQSTVSRFVDLLVTKGYLKKVVEGKQSCAYPTEAAKAAKPAIEKAWENLYIAYSNILGEEEGKELTKNTYNAYKKLKKHR